MKGDLEDALGSPHTFPRRKGNKNTLLDKDGTPILEAEIQRLLGAVDDAYFDSMFGLGSEELRQGANELLRGEGRLGEASSQPACEGLPSTGIGSSFSDGDEPMIAGLRAGDTNEVLVPGMSEGTRDQLYLALRLAGLELHLEDHEPMPMILDELLVHFDDARAGPCLACGRQSRRAFPEPALHPPCPSGGVG